MALIQDSPHRTAAWPGLRQAGLALMLALGFAALWVLGSGRYYAIQLLGEARLPLFVLHELAKLSPLLVAALAVPLYALAANRPVLLAPRPQLWLIGLHLAMVLGVLALQRFMPMGRPPSGTDLSALPALYATSIALFYGAAVTGALILLPLHGLSAPVRQALWQRSRFVLGVAAVSFAVVILSTRGASMLERSAPIRWMGELLESVTLQLSLFFYTAAGFDHPVILAADNGDPLLFQDGFAIQMAPACAGYQGMLTSVAILGVVLAFDWRRLHIPRALTLALATVAAVFVMNSVRIAVLFWIGVHVSERIALNGFHSYFGTLSLLALVGMSLLILQHPVFDRARVAAGGPPTRAPRPAPLAEYADLVPLIMPLAIMLAVSFTVGTVQGPFNWLYFIPALVGAGLMWVVRDRIVEEMRGAPTLSALVCGVAVYVMWIALIPVDPERVTLFDETLGAAALPVVIAWIVVRVLGSSIVVPVLEELAFRAGLQRLIARFAAPQLGAPMAMVTAVLLSSVAFGLMHADILAATLAGLAYGVLAAWRGRVGDAIVAHAVTNFLIAMHVLALGHWSYW